MGNCNSANPPKTTLFKQKRNGVTYRIPALIYISDAKTFLAFAEKRKSSDDSKAELLVMRRGTFHNQAVKWSPAEELSTARLPGYRTMNPCPVYEKESKTLFLFFICVLGNTTEGDQLRTGKNAAKLCYVTSRDNGKSWGEVTDLTKSVIGDEICNWATFAIGPGHGLQMMKGRLIIPAYVYYIHCHCCFFSTPYAFAFCSDDKGKTWHKGERVEIESLECQMAEIIDQDSVSHLYCNARTKTECRIEAFSTNHGKTFNRFHFAEKLVETGGGCQGSVVSYIAPHNETWLIYSHSTSKTERKALGIYVNKCPLNKADWNKRWIINQGCSGYSDLTFCEDTRDVGCLMECGVNQPYEEIAFVKLPENKIQENKKTLKK